MEKQKEQVKVLPANVKKWVDALRSGAYTQARHHLRYRDHVAAPYRYCALGVAIEVALSNGVEVKYPWMDYCLPPEVRDWLGCKGSTAKLNGDSVSALNDSYQKSFSEIADEIEAHPEAFQPRIKK